MPYATLAEAFASPNQLKQPVLPPSNQEFAKKVALSDPVGANIPAGTPVEWRQSLPQESASMSAGLPKQQSVQAIHAPGPNALAIQKPMEPVPNSREPIRLPTSMFAESYPDEKSTPIHKLQKLVENFTDGVRIKMPTNQEEWSQMLRKILAFGIENGWVLPQDLVVLFQRGTSRDWNLWLQEMIPYVLIGVFLVFFVNTTAKLFK